MVSKSSLAAAIVAALGLFAHASLGAGPWDLTGQFGVANGNPNGAWSYGWETPALNGPDAASFTVFNTIGPGVLGYNNNAWMTPSGMPMIWRNDLGFPVYGVAPGQVSLHPDQYGNASVARWTAPAGTNATIEIAGQFYPGDAQPMLVSITHNGTSIFSGYDSGAFDLFQAVQAGDTVDFAVTQGPYGHGYGNTPLEATIRVVPEPASTTVLALAAGGLLLRRRKEAEKGVRSLYC